MAGRVGLGVLTSHCTGSPVLMALAALREHVSVRSVLCGDVTSARDQIGRAGLQVDNVGKVREWNDMCNDESVDAMIMCSTDGNVNMVRRALKEGKSVFCDRLISLQYSALAACYEEAEAKNAHLSFGFKGRNDPLLEDVRIRIDEGVVGNVEKIHTSIPYQSEISQATNTGRIFKECVSEKIDTFCWLLKDTPLSVHAESDSDDCINVLLRFTNTIGTMHIHRSTNQDNQLHIQGSKGSILLTDGETNNNSTISEKDGTKATQNILTHGLKHRCKTALSRSILRFIQDMKGNTSPLKGHSNVLSTMALTAACQHALESKAPVTIPTQDNESLGLRNTLWKERPAAWF